MGNLKQNKKFIGKTLNAFYWIMLILAYCSTEYTLNIILRGASASKNAAFVVKVFEVVFRVGRYPPFVPRLIKASLNQDKTAQKCNIFLDLER